MKKGDAFSPYVAQLFLKDPRYLFSLKCVSCEAQNVYTIENYSIEVPFVECHSCGAIWKADKDIIDKIINRFR